MAIKINKDKFTAFINKLSINTCDICGTNEWQTDDNFTYLPIIEGSDGKNTGKSYPAIIIRCKTCGNTKLINPIIAGFAEEMDGENDGK